MLSTSSRLVDESTDVEVSSGIAQSVTQSQPSDKDTGVQDTQRDLHTRVRPHQQGIPNTATEMEGDISSAVNLGYSSSAAADTSTAATYTGSGPSGIAQSSDQMWNLDLDFDLDAHMEMFDGFFFGDLPET